MQRLKYICFTSVLFLFSFCTFAQAADRQQTGFMNSNGKIYVVMAVVVLIVLGLFLYLYLLDKKISKIEKEANSHSSRS